MQIHPSFILIMLVTALLFCPAVAAQGPLPFNRTLAVEEAIEMALANNHDIAMAATEIEKARAALKKSEAAFMPSLTLFSEYTAGDAPSAYLFKKIDQRDLPDNLDFNHPGSFTNLETGVMARVNLYRGGQDELTKQMAAVDLTSAESMVDGVQNEIVSMVILSFFSALKAGEYVAIAEDSLATVEEQLRIMRIRHAGGSVLRSDILSLEVRAAEARQELVKSRNRHSSAINALTTLIAHEPVEILELDGDCECPVVLPSTYDQAMEIALEARPEMFSAAALAKKARLGQERAIATYLPSLDLGARYYMDSDNLSYSTSKENYTAGLTFKWDLFTGGTSGQEIILAKQELDRAISFQQKMRLMILSELKNAFLNLEDAKERIRVTRTSVEMAEETLNLIKIRYEGGSDSVTRYLESELAWNRARISMAAAFYDKKIAQSEIARAMGILRTLWNKESL
jgi:outer membrane protein TolC